MNSLPVCGFAVHNLACLRSVQCDILTQKEIPFTYLLSQSGALGYLVIATSLWLGPIYALSFTRGGGGPWKKRSVYRIELGPVCGCRHCLLTLSCIFWG